MDKVRIFFAKIKMFIIKMFKISKVKIKNVSSKIKKNKVIRNIFKPKQFVILNMLFFLMSFLFLFLFILINLNKWGELYKYILSVLFVILHIVFLIWVMRSYKKEDRGKSKLSKFINILYWGFLFFINSILTINSFNQADKLLDYIYQGWAIIIVIAFFYLIGIMFIANIGYFKKEIFIKIIIMLFSLIFVVYNIYLESFVGYKYYILSISGLCLSYVLYYIYIKRNEVKEESKEISIEEAKEENKKDINKQIGKFVVNLLMAIITIGMIIYTIYLFFYEFDDGHNLFISITTVFASIVGGSITLAGVVFTIDNNNKKWQDDQKQLEKEKKRADQKEILSSVIESYISINGIIFNERFIESYSLKSFSDLTKSNRIFLVSKAQEIYSIFNKHSFLFEDIEREKLLESINEIKSSPIKENWDIYKKSFQSSIRELRKLVEKNIKVLQKCIYGENANKMFISSEKENF